MSGLLPSCGGCGGSAWLVVIEVVEEEAGSCDAMTQTRRWRGNARRTTFLSDLQWKLRKSDLIIVFDSSSLKSKLFSCF
jgi:hypothetical protein